MMTFEEFKKKKLVLEFNGPVGQPDPSGVSSPALQPRFPRPAAPKMGTQPGMSMEKSSISPYDTFMQSLQGKHPNEIMQTFNKLQQDMPKLFNNQSFGR